MPADIDIDLAHRDQVLALISHTAARQVNGDREQRHASGIYVTDIPRDPRTGWAALDYRDAEDLGYFKIDLLNMSVYQLIRDAEHYDAMLNRPAPWSRLWEDPEWTRGLVHIGEHQALVARHRPDSIPRMAALISIIRPGKAHLQGQSWERIFQEVWDGDTSRGFTFKKAHALGYAHLVMLHMNLRDSTPPVAPA